MRAADFEVKENPFEVEPSKAKTTALKTNKKGVGGRRKVVLERQLDQHQQGFVATLQPSSSRPN